MKKAIVALAVLAMLLFAAAAEAADPTGLWHLTEIIEGDAVMNPADFGIAMTIELKAGGAAELWISEGDEVHKGAWTADGADITVTFDDGSSVFTLADGSLTTVGSDGETMRFGREQPAASFEPAAPIEAAPEDFAGGWTAVWIGMDGVCYPADILDDEVTAAIEGDAITMNGFVFSGVARTLTYADGRLSAASTDEATGHSASITVALLEDGMLEIHLEEGEEGALMFYMARIE